MSSRRWVLPTAGLSMSGVITMAVAVAISRSGDQHSSAQVWWTLAFLPLVAAGAMIAAIRPRSALGWLLLTIGTAAEIGRFQIVAIASAEPGSMSFA